MCMCVRLSEVLIRMQLSCQHFSCQVYVQAEHPDTALHSSLTPPPPPLMIDAHCQVPNRLLLSLLHNDNHFFKTNHFNNNTAIFLSCIQIPNRVFLDYYMQLPLALFFQYRRFICGCCSCRVLQSPQSGCWGGGGGT